MKRWLSLWSREESAGMRRHHNPERVLRCTVAPDSFCAVGAEIPAGAVLTVPCVLVKGEPGNDGKPGRQGIPGNPGEKVGEEAPWYEHPLLSVRGPLLSC